MPACHAGGREFESLPGRHFFYFNITILCDPLAQLVEHLTFNQGVGRSSRPWVTILEDKAAVKQLLFLFRE